MNFLSLFTQKELIIIYVISGILVTTIVALIIAEIVSHGKKDEIDILLDEAMEDSHEETEQVALENKEVEIEKEEIEIKTDVKLEEVKQEIKEEEVEPVLVKKIEKVEPVILDDSESIIVTPVVNQENVETKVEEVEVTKQELTSKEKAQLELLKLEEELEHVPSLEDTISNLEQIEESEAIISYQELLQNTKDLSVAFEDDGDEPISINEVFKIFNEENNSALIVNESLVPVTSEPVLSIDEAYKGGFIGSQVISPVGLVKEESITEIQVENTANLEKLDREIRKTTSFLSRLNELKKNI